MFNNVFEKMVLFYFGYWKCIKWVCNECILLEIRLVLIIINIISIIFKILVYWSYLSFYYDFLLNYEVIWKVNGSLGGLLGFFERIIKEYIVFCYLMVG